MYIKYVKYKNASEALLPVFFCIKPILNHLPVMTNAFIY